MRAPWGGRGGPERGAAIAPRACPVRGCSHLESGCPCPQSPEEASAPFWVALDASRQKQAEAGARGSLGARSTPGFASPYFPVLKVTAAPSGEAKLTVSASLLFSRCTLLDLRGLRFCSASPEQGKVVALLIDFFTLGRCWLHWYPDWSDWEPRD